MTPDLDGKEILGTGNIKVMVIDSRARLKPIQVSDEYVRDCTNGFALENKLGGGTFSEVFKGQDAELKKHYAVKRIPINLDENRRYVARRMFKIELAVSFIQFLQKEYLTGFKANALSLFVCFCTPISGTSTLSTSLHFCFTCVLPVERRGITVPGLRLRIKGTARPVSQV